MARVEYKLELTAVENEDGWVFDATFKGLSNRPGEEMDIEKNYRIVDENYESGSMAIFTLVALDLERVSRKLNA